MLALACSGGQSGAEGPIGPDPGGPGLPGQSECLEDLECRDKYEAQLEALSQPAPRTLEVTASRCEPLGVSFDFESVQGNACYCDTADGGQLTLGPVGVGCYLIGRDGSCIFGDADYAACDTLDTSTCDAVCEEAAARVEADSNRPIATELLLAECRASNCAAVVSVNGRCYINNEYGIGRERDCALGAEAILEASDAANTPPELTPEREDNLSYAPSTSATLNLGVMHDWYGSELVYQGFGASAQFFETIEGVGSQSVDVIDPLEGIDDCGVSRMGSFGAAPELVFLDVDRVVVRDGAAEHAFDEFAPGAGFYSYGLDLAAVGVTPRHDGGYGFAASGGGFGASIELGVVLPEDLSIPALEHQTRFERGALDLTWTGRGAAPLRLSLLIATSPGQFSSYRVECRLEDDGAFTLPSAVLEAVPEGEVLASFSRVNRQVQRSGGKSIQTVAAVSVNHRFALGPACDGAASMAACQASAQVLDAAYEACGVEPVPRATLCPDYISESCTACPEYFECVARTTACSDAGLSVGSFECTCP